MYIWVCFWPFSSYAAVSVHAPKSFLGGRGNNEILFCTGDLDLQKKVSRKYRVPIHPYTKYTVSVINILRGGDVCCNWWADINTLLLKTIVAIRFTLGGVHSSVCTDVYGDTHPPLGCHTEWFHGPKKPCAPPTHLFLLLPWIPDRFIAYIILPFFI